MADRRARRDHRAGDGARLEPDPHGFDWGPSLPPSVEPTAYSPTDTTWKAGEVESRPLTGAPDQEPGLDVAGSTYLGPANLASAADPNGTVPLLVSLHFSNADQLYQLLSGLSDPGSPEYHHYLSHAEFDSEFGGDQGVYSSLVAYFQSFGVTHLTTHPERISLTFQATIPQVESAFHTGLGDFRSATGQPYFAPLSTPELPSVFAPYLAEVQGFSNYSEYLTHAESTLVTQPAFPSVAPTQPRTSLSPASSGLTVSPGGSLNPFTPTTVSGRTFDKPVTLSNSTSCSAHYCGQMMEGPDLQVAYNETGLFSTFGYPVNATVVAMLWSDTICTRNTSTCNTGGYYNGYCSSLTTGSYAWDFFMPDVTAYWNYTLPSGEPMPHAVSMPVSGSGSYAYPSGSQGYTSACDSGGAEGENTLDVAMEGSLAPGANVLQVFSQGSTTAALTTEFSDILGPTSSEFSTTGGFDTPADRGDLNNTSVIANSWGSSSSLGTSTAWVDDLKEAQTLGITILASSGDGGTNALEAPAENSYNTYGAVAVGGTTLVLNTTTLHRTPAHVASMASPYDGVGGGEIVWYEPSGSAHGFSSALGSIGGVTSSSTNYAPTWQNGSADAYHVITGIRSSGYGRGEPDLSAIANDTPIDIDMGWFSFNVTCLVSTSCTQISHVSSSSVEHNWTYFVGTSISDQVAGGEIAVIDHVLRRSGQPPLGFLNPLAYSEGQLQDSSDLSLDSFYDVTVYHNAESSSTYGAFTGWDADTGWGTIDAGNITQNVLHYAIQISETGLSSGSMWSVTVTPEVGDANCTVSGSACTNSLTRSSSAGTLLFNGTYGRYTYSVNGPSSLVADPSSGTVSLRGENVTIAITFVPAPPTGLTATAVSATVANLTWSNPSTSLTNTYLYGYDGESCSGSPFYDFHDSSAVTSFQWTALFPSTTYSWEVTAVSAFGESARSSCANATTYSVPSAPTGLTATAASAKSVNLAWSNPSGSLTNTYLYGYNGASCSGSPFYDFHDSSAVTSFQWTSLSPSTTYSWEVTAVSIYGESPKSHCANATTDGVTSAPTGLSASAGSATAVNLTWSNPSGYSDKHFPLRLRWGNVLRLSLLWLPCRLCRHELPVDLALAIHDVQLGSHRGLELRRER